MMKTTCWKSKKSVPLLALALVLSLFMTGTATAADFAIMVKSGGFKLWDESQNLDAKDRNFDEHSDKPFALAWEIRNAKGVGLGMEYITYQHEYTPPTTGNTKTQIFLFSARKYYSPNQVIHPFAGIGLGWGHAKVNDGQGNIDRDVNLALQFSFGIEFRFVDNFAFYTELKGLASGTDGDEDNEFDFSSSAAMAGVSFIF